MKNSRTIVKLRQTTLYCSFSYVDHVDSLWYPWYGFTTSLWIQYINVVQILRKFTKAERLGNWYLHIQAVSEKLPQLAVSCVKSARIYLNSMLSLHRALRYTDTLHRGHNYVARRSNHAWTGLSTDLMIEYCKVGKRVEA